MFLNLIAALYSLSAKSNSCVYPESVTIEYFKKKIQTIVCMSQNVLGQLDILSKIF